MKKYIEYYRDNVFYLPEVTPEAIIWDEDFAKNNISIMNIENKDDIASEINELSNYKEKFMRYSQVMFGTANVESAYRQFLTNWINKKDYNYNKIVQIINAIKNK
ncbi:hypothetical protein [Methanohalophilus halophilus]|uniref:Uncharacterized protein n=1 Tax=Methanohalophilus halophilus TaxID=2177 RepID=A0A1L3Q235_9EURY|nr:hypothetical protein [Methanohalophilus halophilus]APH38936.1 hypothetical protein BHR79_05150 [Methanohalophilus halophilus]RNI07438.1 hypothetical protein EFE40_09575 [Methanohalophilus halophilus]SDW66038.1 hypothetical protein SAMN04515625_1342 [Methanohalophilus halophilus]